MLRRATLALYLTITQSPLPQRFFASLATLLALVIGAHWTAPAAALPAGDPTDDQVIECIGNIHATLTASASQVNLGQMTTLAWRATIPVGCAMIRIYLDGLVVPATGSRTLQPIATQGHLLRAAFRSAGRTLATRGIKVLLPNPLTISSSAVIPQLLQALSTENQTIIVQNNVDMNLTDWNGPLSMIPIANGVVLRGGRTARNPGPRLYTTNRTGALLLVSGVRVRITGMRIQGADMGVVDGDEDGARGILIFTPADVEIDHNEFSGWSWAAINVRNPNQPPGFLNSHAVHVHDNFIHHNQHSGTNGYGVAMADGAYAWIERNVFDWNRHAITAEDGSDGSGYEAFDNLVLSHGGYHRDIPIYGWTRTHQFDIHGQDTCGVLEGDHNCGTAGHSAFIRRNTFLYTADASIKLRGKPQLQPWGVFVDANVFASNADDAIELSSNASGMERGSDNLFGVDESGNPGFCDFDGDGTIDSFMATGATWWFASSGIGPWTFLRASTSRRSEVLLGDFDGDHRCDVKVGTTVYSGGTTVLTNVPPTGGGVLAH